MEHQFYVGQEVCCVDDKAHDKFMVRPTLNKEMNGLTKGIVYTIRGFHPKPRAFGAVGIYLNEIDRGSNRDGLEAPFHSYRFRPVVKTDISIFEAMLKPVRVSA